MTLLVESGARRVTLGDLEQLPVPLATATWQPLPHHRVVDMVLECLDMVRFEVSSLDLAIAKQGGQFFGVIDVQSEIVPGVKMAVGIRNSTDRSLSAALCAGERVIVCSNLCFSAEIQVSHKHTSNVNREFGFQVLEAVKRLRDYSSESANRIQCLRGTTLDEDRANSLILQSWKRGIVGTRLLKPLIREWEQPTYEDFQDRSAWSLLNCFTTVLKKRQTTQPVQAAMEAMAFQQLITV